MIDSWRPKVNLFIFGGRDYTNYPYFCATVDRFIADVLTGFEVTIVEGEARGVDLFAYQYAIERGLEWLPFPADWETHGRRAGFIRNHDMCQVSHYGLGFWNGFSSGSAHSVSLCRAKGIPLWVVKY